MNFTLLRTAFFIAVVATVISGMRIVQAGQPRIAFDSAETTVGEVKQGQDVRRTFAFTNVGTAPLHVTDVESDCGCAATLLSKTIIEPGEGGALTVTLDSVPFEGPFKRAVKVRSNDPSRGEVSLHLIGTVIPEIRITPMVVDFGVLPAGSIVQRTLMVETVFGGARPEAVSADHPRVTARLGRTANGLVPLVAVLRSNETTGRLYGNLTIRTTSALRPQIGIPFRAVVERP